LNAECVVSAKDRRGAREWTVSTYRRLANPNDLVTFRVRMKQTNMSISAQEDLTEDAIGLVRAARTEIERRIEEQPEFKTSLAPLPFDPAASEILRVMLEMSERAQVGPMASVAGAIAEYVGRGLANRSPEIIVENGGDIFLKSAYRREIAVVAENSSLKGMRIALPPVPEGAGVATSAGTLGHSMSFGRADAVTIFASTAALADSIATAVGNVVRTRNDLPRAIAKAGEYGARGALIIADDHMAAWGEIELLD